MRVVFFGTPQFAVPTLERLLDSSHTVVAVVAQPDKPSGRGLKLAAPPVKLLAQSRGIPVLQPKSVKTAEFAEALRSLAADVAVVVAYGKILPKAVLEIPRHGCLNVHASLLPSYRGAAPIQWAVANGERRTGISIMKLDEGMDTGPVALMEEVDILEDDDARSLADMLSMVGADAMLRTLDRLERDGELHFDPQDHARASHAPLIERENARIDWKQSAERIICLVRGFVVWPKAFTTLDGAELKITAVEMGDRGWLSDEELAGDRVAPGTVIDVLKGRGFLVKAGDGNPVLVRRVQFPGKAEIGADDAVNGGLVKIGMRLGT